MNNRIPDLIIPPQVQPSQADDPRSILITEENKGEFWKPCPGTTGGYYCCGYQIITPMTGCAMYCRYCVLQVYFEQHHRVVYSNMDDLKKEIHLKMANRRGVIRFGTGEFADSLHAESETGCAVAIAELLEPYPMAILELKTKSASIDTLGKIKRPYKVIISFSLNTPRMIERMEYNTASLNERFDAVRKCLDMGFNIAFHFDPIFWYDQWENEYCEVVDRIYATVTDVNKIAWCSLGGFRSNPALKTYLKEHNMHLPLFSGEMITGVDGKIRYFRPIRVALYQAMRKAFYRHQADAPVYLCMESREVWDEAGLIDRIPDGLPAYLDAQACRLLSVEHNNT